MTVGKVKDFNFSSGGMAKGYAMGGSANCYAKGGKVMEKSTGESYPSRRAMEKHESMETPRMQRKEVIQRETVKAPSAPREMLQNRGALGVLANKNPGETAMNTAPNLPGKMMLKKGGPVIPKAGYKKIDKVMGEFKAGDLHSGSKTGPKVTGTKQAVAIALSEARRADKKAK
jgi:hypothetical protein